MQQMLFTLMAITEVLLPLLSEGGGRVCEGCRVDGFMDDAVATSWTRWD